ncbi:MAG: MBL fold metallo-hydrolase [Jaaginema sp. PMC 1079.18]|nr:MBL fold metallo-hydrolase [Jaaginema sp. PMC 1080.18]MEC4852411.1 MBL fold metallo-hydrolase [Jaaginema sp. PMC 1079.18]MEC4865661.1 MBL fold metallo-hydrolase [Jaaginema sp. PMC 1078.18]
MYLTWFDSNSWLIEVGDTHILLDPWLVDSLVFGKLPWLFKGTRSRERIIPSKIDLILLSQGLEDHAHPATLKQLDRDIPVFASPSAAKVVRDLGYTQIITLEHGQNHRWGDRLNIQAVPGSPLGPLVTENGYIIRDRILETSLYYEPHGHHSEMLKTQGPIDVVISPVVDLSLPFGATIIQGFSSALQMCEWLQPQVLIPTAAGGDVEFTGLLNNFIEARGSIDAIRVKLAKANLPTQLLEPTPGERFAVPIEQSSPSL